MNQPQNNPSQQEIVVSDVNDDEIDILGLIQTLGEEKWLLFGLPFICSCVAAMISLYLTPIYIAKATFIVPDKQSSSASAVLDQLGSLGGLAGTSSKSSTEMYVALMQSKGAISGDESVLEDAIALAGVSKYPARIKCALLGWMAFKDASVQAQAKSELE